MKASAASSRSAHRRKGCAVGQRVGIGWYAHSCLHCASTAWPAASTCARRRRARSPAATARFADRVRCHWVWAVPLPDALPAAESGPLLCGGITVFAPLELHGIRPTDRVGVVGIGGLGHMALKFCRAWGCEVTAFTSSASKARRGACFRRAPRRLQPRHGGASRRWPGRFDLILDTVNVPLDWNALLGALAPGGRLHVVGAVLEPIPVAAFALISGQKSVSGSPTGSRGSIDAMLDFAARHGIAPQTEHFPMSRVNDALDHLRAGKARYRIVLDAVS